MRYADYPKDETYWLKEELGGKLVHISQYKIESRLNGEVKIFRPPVNEEERRNEPMLEEEADYILQWEFNTDMMNKDTYIASKVNEFINWLSSYKE